LGVKKLGKHSIGIEIDKLTNSILNTISGDSFATNVSEIEKSDLKLTSKKNGWLFAWSSEFKQPDRKVYKLTIRDNPK